jgi:hypothetical protein
MALLLSVAAWVSGCGGGGSDSESDSGNGQELSSDASLSSLSVSTGQLDQLFQSSLLDYTTDVAFLQASVVVSATTADTRAGISIDGNAVVSGAPSPPIALAEGVNTISIMVLAEDDSTSRTYTVTVTREAGPIFAQQAYIKASNTDLNSAIAVGDQFGWRLAISGDTLAVSARVEASNGDGVNSGAQANNDELFAGAVYVFERAGEAWSQQAYIKASNSEGNDYFGYSLALSGDTLAVGAYGEAGNGVGVNSGAEANNDAPGSGAVYVFTRSAGAWNQQAYIKASNTETNDRFGWQLALSDDTLAVGAWGEDSDGVGVNSATQASIGAPDSGAVYIFARNTGVWSQQAYVKASNTQTDDYFGYSLALDGDTLAVGAWGEDSNGTGVNSSAESNNSWPGSGAVYVFTRTGGTWTQQAYVKASNTDPNDLFGFSLALDGDTLAVGAYAEESNGVGVNGGAQDNDSFTESGAVYVFARVAGAWGQQAYIKASNNDAGDRFGYSLALAGDTLAVGAYREDGNGTGVDSAAQGNNDLAESGSVYLFTRGVQSWHQQAYVKASNSGVDDYFGHSLALGGDRLAVGAYGEGSSGVGVDSATQLNNDWPEAGAVYVFQ